MDNTTNTEIEISFSNFLGLDNVSDPTRLNVGKDGIRQTIATNVDVYSDNTLARRDGYTRVSTGAFERIWSQGGTFLGIKDNNLVQITKSGSTYTFTQVMAGAENRPIIYADTGLGIYFSDGSIIKVFKNGIVSDIPATTLDFKIPTPAGHILEYHKSRLYVAVGSLIFITDSNHFDIIDGRVGIKSYGSKILMWKALSTGIYMSDSYNTCFLRDLNPDELLGAKIFGYKRILNYPAILGTGQKIYNIITPANRSFDEAIIWTSSQGICIGGPNGEVENVTEKTYDMPSVVEGTDIYRKIAQDNQYISILKIRG